MPYLARNARRVDRREQRRGVSGAAPHTHAELRCGARADRHSLIAGMPRCHSRDFEIHATFRLTVIAGGKLQQLPRPVAKAKPVVIRASLAVETPRVRAGCVVRLEWRRARFTAIRVHDNRVDPHAEEKLA